MYKITELGEQRYIGDTSTMTIHDRWNDDCEGCHVQEIIDRGVAVAFEPDNLDHAFMLDFDYCDHCFGRFEPKRPDGTPGAARRTKRPVDRAQAHG